LHIHHCATITVYNPAVSRHILIPGDRKLIMMMIIMMMSTHMVKGPIAVYSRQTDEFNVNQLV